MQHKAILTRRVLAWAFYDWANSAFALSILAVLFPLFMGAYWSAGDPGLVPGGSEYRTSHLTEPAAVAMGYLVVMFGNVGRIHPQII
mgnify:CR=1 FL=1